MSIKLNQALEQLRQLPQKRQDELADVITSLAKNDAGEPYSTAQLALIDEGIADADAGRFVSEDEIQATFARFLAV